VERDLYEKAEAGQLEGKLPGVSVPYEEPTHPEVQVPSHQLSPYESAKRIVDYVEYRWERAKHFLSASAILSPEVFAFIGLI
jgi:adenylylsulfate kinase-like enzyme